MGGDDEPRRPLYGDPEMPADVLSLRALNRAALERQLLLTRSKLPVVAAIERAVGVNAQAAKDPYFWLWARLTDFRIEQLTEAIESRRVVRSTMMRVTSTWSRPMTSGGCDPCCSRC
jgi:hypothetical protein